jgi:hypothetical protein
LLVRRARRPASRVRPSGEKHIHVFVAEQQRELVLAMYPEFLEKLTWGAKVVGLRVTLAKATASVVEHLVSQAWENKAPKRLLKASNADRK